MESEYCETCYGAKFIQDDQGNLKSCPACHPQVIERKTITERPRRRNVAPELISGQVRRVRVHFLEQHIVESEVIA